MKAESLLLLQALEGVIDQAFADVEPFTVASGDCLIQEGQISDDLILITSGVVEARWQGFMGNQPPRLGPGSVLGDISFLMGEQRGPVCSPLRRSRHCGCLGQV